MVKKIGGLAGLAELAAAANPLAWPALYLILLAVGLSGQVPLHQPNLWVGFMAIILYARFPIAPKAGRRFLAASLLFACLYLFIPNKALITLALIGALLFSIEAIAGKLHTGALPAIFLMLPLANDWARVLSFPMRLQLSKWAAFLLNLTGSRVEARGNTLLLQGMPIEVDYGCPGLSMLVCSLLIGLISIQLFEAKFHRRLPLPYLPLALLYFTGFNILANLIRIICLAYLHLGPDSWLHGPAGLACWALFGVVPPVILIGAVVKNLGLYEPVKPLVTFHPPSLPLYQLTQLGLLLLLSLFMGLKKDAGKANSVGVAAWPPLQGLQPNARQWGATTFTPAHTQVYVKPLAAFYSTGDSPSNFWRGSGYAFTRVRQAKRENGAVYMANLEKRGATLYTAWWYQSGTHRTNNQFCWRWRCLTRDRPYQLVNITASSQAGLETAIKNWGQDGNASVNLP